MTTMMIAGVDSAEDMGYSKSRSVVYLWSMDDQYGFFAMLKQNCHHRYEIGV